MVVYIHPAPGSRATDADERAYLTIESSGMVGGTETGRWKRLLIGVDTLVLGVLAVGCSSSTAAPSAAPASTAPAAVSSLTALPQYSGFMAAYEFVVGKNRFPFALLSNDRKPLEGADVQVSFFSLEKQAPEFRFQAPARFLAVRGVTPHSHDDGTVHEHMGVRGVYVVDSVSFDDPGTWIAQFVVTAADIEQPQVQGAAFAVLPEPGALGVGESVPASHNLTLANVDSIEEIETRVPPDDMHELSVAQALEEGKPFVVVFATPMFCVSRMCGPVTDVVAELHTKYREQVNFIHIEPWDLAVARGEGRLIPTEVMLEWDLPTEPWVFLVGGDGRVVARFEGLVSSEELESSIVSLTEGSGSD